MQSSNSQLIDGKSGEPIGYANYPTNTNTSKTYYVQTTTSNYVPATTNTYATNYVYGTGSGAVSKQYAVGGGYYTSTSAVPATTTVTATNAQVVGTTVNTGKQVIKGESRIEYVPFQKKIIEYKDQSKVQRVPKKVKKIEYREQRKIQTIPKQVTVTDYYAVQHLRQYIPQYVPQKRIEYVQVPKKQVRYEYIPVQRQIVHYPDQALDIKVQGGSTTGQISYQGGQYVTGGNTYNIAPQVYATGQTTTTTNYVYQKPATTTNYTYEQPVSTAYYEQPTTYTYEQPATTYTYEKQGGNYKDYVYTTYTGDQGTVPNQPRYV